MSLSNNRLVKRWAREMEYWLHRRSPFIDEETFILTFYIKDGVILRRDLSTTANRKQDAELVFPDIVSNGSSPP